MRSHPRPLPLDEAVAFLADALYPAIRDHRRFGFKPIRVAIDPFHSSETGQVLRASREIDAALAAAAGPGLNVRPMTPENIRDADYAINGTIERADADAPEGARWRIRAMAVDLRDGGVVGEADVWVTDPDLDVRPIPIHADSPVFFDHLPRPPRSGPEYLEGLGAAALLAEAETLYGRGDYRGAAALLRQIVAADAGPILKAWSGLYASHRKLGNTEAMVEAFDRLVAASVERYAVLTIKFLFRVNATEFWPDAELRRQYALWLERIGLYFHRNPKPCLLIEGHSSRTGPETFNERLSLERALRIQKSLGPFFPDVAARTRAAGRGFSQTILGIGTDDARDLIDRRVVFEIIDCDTVTRGTKGTTDRNRWFAECASPFAEDGHGSSTDSSRRRGGV